MKGRKDKETPTLSCPVSCLSGRARSKGEEGDTGPRNACEAGEGELRRPYPIAGQWVFHGAGVAWGIYHPRERRPSAPPPGNGFWSRNRILVFRQDPRVLCDADGDLGEEFFGAEGRGECVRPYGHAEEQERQVRGTRRNPRQIPRPVTRVASRRKDLPDKRATGNR